VSDIQAACDFYTQKLGFALAFIYGEPPFYAQVVRGAARLNLRHVDMPAFHPELRQRERDILSATITLDDVKALFLEYTANGVPFHQPLRLEPWGARTFIVCDPDGNLIAFAG
jgi:catechol 2,3-dioxygenase-like lactoylglutathione lyase family enzyme